MEEFLQLAREVQAYSPTPLDYESSSCLNGFNGSALLDDSSSGIIFPTGENLPSITPNTIRDNHTEVESNAVSSTMNRSITISPLETGMIPEVSLLQIDEQENFYYPPSETDQMSRCLPSNLPTSGQFKSTGCVPSPLLAAYPVQHLGNNMSAQRTNHEQLHNANGSRFCEMPQTNRGLDTLPDFGDEIGKLLTPYPSDSPAANIPGQVKQELPTFYGSPDLAMSAGGPVSVRITPPPADKKKTSTCKVVDDRVFVKLNRNFYLTFCGSEEALRDTEICLETSYLEPDNRDTPVRACGMHGDSHARTCSREHHKQLAFLCTDGLVPVQDKYDRYRSYTPLSDIIGHKLEEVAPGVWAFNLKTTALCWNSCHQHKDNGKNVLLTVSMRSKTDHMAKRSCEFGVTCCESPTRDSKPPVRKRRRVSSSSTVCHPINIPNSPINMPNSPINMPNSPINMPNSPINILNRPINIRDSPSCLMSPRSQSSSPASSSCEETSALAKNFTVRVPMLSSEEARRVYELLMNMGIKCSLMEHRMDM